MFRFINPTKTDNWDVEVLLSDKSFIRTLHGKFMSLYYCENAEPVVELAMEPLDAVPETFSRGFRTWVFVFFSFLFFSSLITMRGYL